MVATKRGRPYRGVSAEDRQEQRRRRLLDAGLVLFGHQGFANTRVRDVCVESGLTERYFYESFRNLDALFEAVFDDIMNDVVRAAFAIAEAPYPDFATRLRAVLSAVAGHLTDEPARGRVIFVEAFGPAGKLEKRRDDFLSWLAGLVRQWEDQAGVTPAVDATDRELSTLGGVGAAAELMIAWVDGRINVPRERVVEHLALLYEAVRPVSSLRTARDP